MNDYADAELDDIQAGYEGLTHVPPLIAIIRSLRAEVAGLRHDIDAYRGMLGYAVPGDHNGLLMDGTRPCNGISEAADAVAVRVVAERDALRVVVYRLTDLLVHTLCDLDLTHSWDYRGAADRIYAPDGRVLAEGGPVCRCIKCGATEVWRD